jgi:hypothetical protein
MSESDQSDIATSGPSDTGDVPADAPENAPRAAEQQAAAHEPSGDTLGSPTAEPGVERDPEEWVTGDQPATEPQKSYLDSLARQAGEEISADLTKAEASQHIERLQGDLGVEGS